MLAHFSSARRARSQRLARASRVRARGAVEDDDASAAAVLVRRRLVRKRPLRSALTAQVPSAALGAALSWIVIGSGATNRCCAATPKARAPLRVDRDVRACAGDVAVAERDVADVRRARGEHARHGAFAACARWSWRAVLALAQRRAAAAVRAGRIQRAAAARVQRGPDLFPVPGPLSVAAAVRARVRVRGGDRLRRGGAAWRVHRCSRSSALVALALRTVQYEGAWQSETRLWGHAASTQPEAYYAWTKLGEVRRKDGDLYGAIRAYQRLVRLDPRRKLGLCGAASRRSRCATRNCTRLAPSRAEAYAQAFYAALDDVRGSARARGTFAASRLRAHVRGADGRVLALAPMPDDALEHAARRAVRAEPAFGRRCSISSACDPTQQADLQALAQRARELRGDAPVL